MLKRTEIADIIAEDLLNNALIFLNVAIKYFNLGINQHKNRVVTVVNLQLATELALKHFLISTHGLNVILEKKSQNLSDFEIKNKYENNTLKLRKFEELRQIEETANNSGASWLFDDVKNFQTYRNHLVHLNHNFTDNEINNISQKIIDIIVYVLDGFINIYENDENKNKMQGLLQKKEYEKLLKNEQYYEELKAKLFDDYGDSYWCPHCDRQLLVPSKICFGCMENFNYSAGYLKCKYCGKKTLIYDKLNIDTNGSLRALCVNCHEDTIVYKCPHCENVYDWEGLEEACYEGYCKYE